MLSTYDDKLTVGMIGNGTLAAECLSKLLKKNILVRYVISNDAVVLAIAKAHQVTDEHKLPTSDSLPSVDYLFSISNNAFLDKNTTKNVKCLTINYHDGPLPRYAGLNATSWALLNGETAFAISWHVTSNQIDAGPLLLQKHIPITPDDTAFSLNAACFDMAMQSFDELLDKLDRADITLKNQDLRLRTYYAKNKKPFAAGLLLLNQGIDTCKNTIRALSFGVYNNPLVLPKLLTTSGKVFYVQAFHGSEQTSASPADHATISRLTANDFYIQTGGHEFHFSGFIDHPSDTLSHHLAKDETVFCSQGEETNLIEAISQTAGMFEDQALKSLSKLTLQQNYFDAVFDTSRNKSSNKAFEHHVALGSDVLHKLSTQFSCSKKHACYALLILLLQCMHTDAIEFGLLSQSLEAQILRGLFEDCQPIKLDLNTKTTLTTFFRSVLDTFLLTPNDYCFHKDIIHRYSSLSHLAHATCEHVFPFTVNLSENTVSPALISQYGLVIDFDNDMMQILTNRSVKQTLFKKGNESNCLCRFMSDALDKMAKTLFTSPELRLIDAQVFPSSDSQRFFNFNPISYDKPLHQDTLHSDFINHVKHRPNATAVLSEARNLSYLEVYEHAVYLVETMKQHGLMQGDRIAIMLKKGWQQVVACLACSLSGLVFLPLAHNEPTTRRNAIMSLANVKGIIAENEFVIDPPSTVNVIIKTQDFISANGLSQIDTFLINPEAIAYIIFTSGSTGNPKGVVISHQAAKNTLTDLNKRYVVKEADRVLALSHLTFDLAIYDIFGTLSAGAAIVMPNQENLKDISYLVDLVISAQVSIWNSVPAFLEALTDYLLHHRHKMNRMALRLIFSSGDWLSPILAQKIHTYFRSVQLVSMGGATEASIWSIAYDVQKTSPQTDQAIPYGFSLTHQRLMVLDTNMNLAPPGMPGMIYIAGQGLANGYLDPKQTDSAFIYHPSFKERLYKTGDYGCYRFDGCILFLGRRDNQVKINGFRVELEEIRLAIMQLQGVNQAQVQYVDDLRVLVGFIQATHSEISAAKITTFLSCRLPTYMIPTEWVFLRSMPSTENNKVDSAALLSYYLAQKSHAPCDKNQLSETERGIFRLWKAVLSKGTDPPNQDFFQLGGNSLDAIKLLGRIGSQYAVNISYAEFVKHATFDALSTLVSKHLCADDAPHQNNHNNINHDSLEVPASLPQRGLWLQCQTSNNKKVYNMLFSYEASGLIDIKQLKIATQDVFDKHDSFNVSFRQTEDKLALVLQKKSPKRIIVTDLRTNDDTEITAGLDEIQLQLTSRTFDLSKGDTAEAHFVLLPGMKLRIHFLFHHIIFDAWSLPLFLTDISLAYASMLTTPSQHSYMQFASLTHQKNQNKSREQIREFWETMGLKADASSHFPTDFPRKHNNFSGKNHYFSLPQQETLALKSYSNTNTTSLYSVLLSCFYVVLTKFSQHRDLCLGCSFANRREPEFHTTVGLFANVLPVQLNASSDEKLNCFIERVNTLLTGLIDMQSITFDQLVDAFNPTRDAGMNPFFQVAFVFLNIKSNQLVLGDCIAAPLEADLALSRFDFIVYLHEDEKGLSGHIEYNTDLLSQSTITSVLDSYLELLSNYMKHIHSPLKNIGIELNQKQLSLITNDQRVEIEYDNVYQAFLAKATQQPDHVAIVSGETTITYSDLIEKSNRMAFHLEQLTSNQNLITPILLDRSIDAVAVILATLKLGRVFLPLSTAWPKSRQMGILKKTHANIVITNKGNTQLHTNKQITIIYIEDLLAPANGDVHYQQAHDMYVIFTSGTTGEPKGVLISHANFLHLMASVSTQMKFSNQQVWTCFHSIAFDFSLWEIFTTLLAGGKLVIASENEVYSPTEFIQLIKQNKVTHVCQTPTNFYELMPHILEARLDLTTIFLGGEKLNFNKLSPWFADTTRPLPELINLYGITESTVHTTFHRVLPADLELGDSVIGHLLPGFSGALIDEGGHVVATGAVGELYLHGGGVCRGYVNDPDETNKRFALKNYLGTDANYYKTRDLMKIDHMGRLIYCGRKDRQVKARGFRIELEEIETALERLPIIESAAVIQSTMNQRQTIPAYVTLSPNRFISENSSYFTSGSWEAVFDRVYSNNNSSYNKEFNISGWVNSINKEPYSEVEMRLWQEDTLRKIRRLKPNRVLEIGCGTGLLLFSLINEVDAYHAIDPSSQAIDSILKVSQTKPEWNSKLTLENKSAHEVDTITATFDLIMINSVIQYFPSETYLNDVLSKASLLLDTGGSLFIGDVRDHDLMNLYYRYLAAHRLENRVAVCDFEKFKDHLAHNEHELLLSKAYFNDLCHSNHSLKSCLFELKAYNQKNEMSLFRYDVILSTDINKKQSPSTTHIDGKDLTLPQLEARVRSGNTRSLTLSSMTNARITDIDSVDTWLHQKDDLSFDDYIRMHGEANFDLDPSQIFNVLQKQFDHVFIIPCPLNTRFFHAYATNESQTPYHLPPQEYPKCSGPHSNAPNFFMLNHDYVYTMLEDCLPKYSMPSSMTVLSRMPVTGSGKIDYHYLETLASNIKLLPGDHIKPSDELQSQLVLAFEKVLSLKNIGIKDNFFHIGGDSITAILLASELQKRGANVRAMDIFRHQTIACLSAFIRSTKPNTPNNPKERTALAQTHALSPMATWFFDLNIDQHYSWPIVAEFKITTTTHHKKIHSTLSAIYSNDKLFGERYQKQAQKWCVHFNPNQTIDAFQLISLMDDDEATACEHYASQLNCDNGPILFLLYFEKTHAIYFIGHHLYFDAVSIYLFFSYLDSHLTDSNDAQPLLHDSSPERTHHFTNLNQSLSINDAPQPINTLSLQQAGLPAHHGPSVYQKKMTLQFDLDLFSHLENSINIIVHDSLLSAMIYAFKCLGLTDSFEVDIERNGRNFSSNVNTASTLGCLCFIQSVTMDLESGSSFFEFILMVKAAMLDANDHFKLASFSNTKDRRLLLFNFHGNPGVVSSKHLSFCSFKDIGKLNLAKNYLFEVNASINKNSLLVDLYYASDISEDYLYQFSDKIRHFLNHCQFDFADSYPSYPYMRPFKSTYNTSYNLTVKQFNTKRHQPWLEKRLHNAFEPYAPLSFNLIYLNDKHYWLKKDRPLFSLVAFESCFADSHQPNHDEIEHILNNHDDFCFNLLSDPLIKCAIFHLNGGTVLAAMTNQLIASEIPISEIIDQLH